jgi:peptidyl-prolyl cis-trans isomerase SurA
MGLPTMEDLEKAVAAQGMIFEDWKSNVKNEMIKRQIIGREVGSSIKISQEEIKKFYDENKNKLERPEMVLLREILISTEGKEGPALEEAQKKADDALARARKGDNFAELAQKVSESESAKNGGDIGAFEKGKMAKDIETAVFALKKGGVSDVFHTKNGLLILKVEDHTQPGIPQMSEVEEQIQNELYMQKMQPALREYLTKLRNEAYLEVRPGYVDSGAPETLSSAHLIPVDVSPEDLTTTVAGAKKGGGKKVYKPWTWIGHK